MSRFGFFAAALPMLALPASGAAPLAAASKITRVTVYQGRASVTREADVTLPAGLSQLVFAGLPQGLDSQALQVGLARAQGVTLGEVDVVPSAGNGSVTANPLAQRIKTLTDSRAAQQVVIDTLTAKRGMMLHFASESPAKLTLDGKPLDIDQWSKAFDSLEAALAKTSDELRLAKAKQADIDAALASLQHAAPPPAVRQTRDVKISLTATSATTAHFTLTYQVPGAGWTPVYEARLKTGADAKGAEVTLIRRAEVSQSTGEPWNNVRLTLSNSTTGFMTRAPEVGTELVDLAPKVPVIPAPQRFVMSKAMAAAPAQPVTAPLVVTRGVDVEFKVPGAVSLANQDVRATFDLTQSQANVPLKLKIAPAFSHTAFLDAMLTNGRQSALLPGPISLYRDGLFEGKGLMPLTAPGARFELGFGADPAVKVERHAVNLNKTGPGFINATRTQMWDYVTKITNDHDFPVDIDVVDRIPVSQNHDVSVKLLPQTSPGTKKPDAGQRGLMIWDFTLKPQETRSLRLAWQVQWPDDRHLDYRQEAPTPLN
ncbi:MAG: mucoidy inhibitor MuiA family protein [Hyphomicrobiales bacterium]|nr:mucoidy inhibitor MuiA family protein [Hyphomicrobiales bacterium]